jgi:hypothetical protein
MKARFTIFLLLSSLLFSNFGLVEYAVLHPKTKMIQADSSNIKQKKVNMYAQASNSNEAKAEEEKSNDSGSLHWGSYIILGIKSFAGFLLKFLAKF